MEGTLSSWQVFFHEFVNSSTLSKSSPTVSGLSVIIFLWFPFQPEFAHLMTHINIRVHKMFLFRCISFITAGAFATIASLIPWKVSGDSRVANTHQQFVQRFPVVSGRFWVPETWRPETWEPQARWVILCWSLLVSVGFQGFYSMYYSGEVSEKMDILSFQVPMFPRFWGFCGFSRLL